MIAHGLANMGKKSPDTNFKLYSEIAHTSKKKRATDDMSAREIIGYIASKL